jgi:hypothetical protein
MVIDLVEILLIHLKKRLIRMQSILQFHLLIQIKQETKEEDENLSNVVEYDVK